MAEMSYDGERFTVIQELAVQNCCNCDVLFGTTRSYIEQRKGDKREFYCPNGHAQTYMCSSREELAKSNETLASENKELKQKLIGMQARLDQVEAKQAETVQPKVELG